MKEQVIKLKNLLKGFEQSRDQKILAQISSEVNAILGLASDIPTPQKKALTFAEMRVSMVINANKHPKIIINNLKKLIEVLENINIEKDAIAA